MRGMKFWSVFSVVTLALVFTAQAKSRSNEELRSDVQSALSLASETELLIGQIEKGRLLAQFQAGHADYLRDVATRHASKLRESFQDSGDRQIVATCAEQLESLAHELALLSTMSGNDESLPKTRERVEAIKSSIIAARAEL
jgi:hypothetical protein